MQFVEDQKKEEVLGELLQRKKGFGLDFLFKVPASEMHFPLYELNGWIGGPGDRVFILSELALYQPSFDGLWGKIFARGNATLELPAIVKFGAFDYQDLDQLAESNEQRQEIQRVLGLLALSISGGCNVGLYSSCSKNMVEFKGEVATLYSGRKADIESGREILSKYEVIKKR